MEVLGWRNDCTSDVSGGEQNHICAIELISYVCWEEGIPHHFEVVACA